MKSSHIRQDIQGLRGIAVASVVLYHAWTRLLPGGFVGVDVFFVISGFVITNTILRDVAGGRFTIAQFYRRRIRRIFPALYTVLAFVLAASWFLLPPLDFLELGKSAFATIFFSSNFFFLVHSNYFDGLATLKPLLHTWSLSVEEQFYVGFPLLVVFILRFRPRLLRPLLIVLSIASLALAALILRAHPSTAFYLAPPRAFELLLGAIIACPGLRDNIPQRIRDGLSLVGLGMIIVALAVFSNATPFPGPTALLPCLGAVMIIFAGIGNGASSLVGKLLSTRPFTFVGDISYSLYLWHWPILVLVRHYFGSSLGVLATSICIGAAVLASWLSLHFVERPFLDKRNDKMAFLRFGLAAMALASIPCLLVVHAKGAPQRFSQSSLALFAESSDFNHRRDNCHSEKKTAAIPYNENCLFGDQSAPPDTAVWGDSHGAELVVAVGDALAGQHRSVMEITASNCPPSLNFTPKDYIHCAAHNSETLARLSVDQRIKMVIVTANFSAYVDDGFSTMLSGYQDAVTGLRAAGKRVVLVYPIPIFDFNPPEILGIRNQRGLALDSVGITRQEFRKQNERAIDLLDSIYAGGGFERVLPEEILCDADLCKAYSGKNGVLYFNNSHLSVTGAKLLAERIPAS